MMSNEMTLNEYINDRVYLFFHPIENLKMAFSKKEKISSRLEIFIDDDLISSYISENTVKKKSEPMLESRSNFSDTFSLQLIDELMIDLFKSRKIV